MTTEQPIKKPCHRNDLGSLLPKDSVGAEIGVHRGYFSVEILKWPVKGLYLIDQWKPYPGDPRGCEDHAHNWMETLANVSGHQDRCFVLAMSSLEAASYGPMPMLDFIYLDAAHDYDNVMADLQAWSKRIKPGGFIFGHDYADNEISRAFGFGVIDAVNNFCAKEGWKLTHLTNEEWPSYVLQRK